MTNVKDLISVGPMLGLALSNHFNQVITSPAGERHEGQRRIVAGSRNEGCAVHHAEVFDIVGTEKWAKDRFSGVSPLRADPKRP
jgi:hypothetical protein